MFTRFRSNAGFVILDEIDVDRSENDERDEGPTVPARAAPPPQPPLRPDFLRQAGAAGPARTVGSRARRPAVVCRPTDSLATVLRLLADHRLDWLPVVSGPGRLVGTISIGDIARCAAGCTTAALEHRSVGAWLAGGEK